MKNIIVGLCMAPIVILFIYMVVSCANSLFEDLRMPLEVGYIILVVSTLVAVLLSVIVV